MKENPDKINIFWTGGLDSTFRLIQLLTTTQNIVQPHYLVDSEESTGIEIDTMIRIRRVILEKFPEVKERFLPTIYTNVNLIPDFKEIDEQIQELRKKVKVNEQYRLMSNYCREYKIEKIELSIVTIPGSVRMFKDYKNLPIFKSFSYPTIELTKKEMIRIAKVAGWDKLLYMTSFCRRPIKKVKPCGICGPCTDTVISGLGYRLPLKSYIKAKLQIPLRKYWRNNYLKYKDKKLYKLVQKILESKV